MSERLYVELAMLVVIALALMKVRASRGARPSAHAGMAHRRPAASPSVNFSER